jgi:hypothetical protein
MKACKSPRRADAMSVHDPWFQKPDGNAGRDGSMAGLGFSSAPAGAKRLLYRIPGVCTLSFLQINSYPAFYNDSTVSHLCRSRRRFALAENMPHHEFR